jgi:uncharacterized membrane protein
VTPEELEERLGRVLGIGSGISAALLALGLGLWLAFGPAAEVTRVLNAGIVVLIVTPVARVVASLIGFSVQRDRYMVLMTALVLVSLILSAAVAVAE